MYTKGEYKIKLQTVNDKQWDKADKVYTELDIQIDEKGTIQTFKGFLTVAEGKGEALIAAAPELLETCKHVLKYNRVDKESTELLEQAIQKAEGV